MRRAIPKLASVPKRSLLLLFVMAPFVGVNLPMQITNIINRFSWNAVLVLAMVPMIHTPASPG